MESLIYQIYALIKLDKGNYRKFILKIVLDTLSHLSLVLAQWYIHTYVSTTGSITNRGHDRLLFKSLYGYMEQLFLI